jgi:hypothetical protein
MYLLKIKKSLTKPNISLWNKELKYKISYEVFRTDYYEYVKAK